MFDSLSERLGGIFETLTKRGALRETDVEDTLRKIRIALLEADVALEVTKNFISAVKEKAIGQDVLKSVTPGQMVVKIVHDQLIKILSGDDDFSAGINLAGSPPIAMLIVGLQGSGKTTPTAKLA